MRDLEPSITRQRLLIEGHFTVDVDRDTVEAFLTGLAARLGLRTYGSPIVHAPEGAGSAENEGFDAFVPLIDSGISLYVWSDARFFAVVLFTCKRFDAEAAVAYTADSFAAPDLEYAAF